VFALLGSVFGDGLFSVAIANESEVQLQDPLVKHRSEPSFVRMLPLPLDYPEGDLLVRRTSNELQDTGGSISRLGILFKLEGRCHALNNEVGVKDLCREDGTDFNIIAFP